MKINKEDFPLYDLIAQSDNPGRISMREAFEAACRGGDEEQYSFALGMQGVALNVAPSLIAPGREDEVMAAIYKTLPSCFKVFQAVAAGTSSRAESARHMVSYCQRELGL